MLPAVLYGNHTLKKFPPDSHCSHLQWVTEHINSTKGVMLRGQRYHLQAAFGSTYRLSRKHPEGSGK